jgi:hypothetical protein
MWKTHQRNQSYNMKKSKIVSVIILAIIGFIFSTDAILLSTGMPTYSEVISEWIQSDSTNLIIFISSVVLLSVHWIFGYYKKNK